MQRAFDKVLDRVVSAKEAAARSTRGDQGWRYRCRGANCKADVFIRRLWDGPIFAHRSGCAAPHCEEYHAGLEGYGYGGTRGINRLNEIDQLKRPGLELYVDSALRNWKLTYFLPRHKLPGLTFPIDVAPGAKVRKISTAVLKEKPLRFDVVPSRNAIGYAGDEDDDSFDEDYFQPINFRLNNTGLNIFHASGFGGYRRAVGAQLFWDTSYFAIWSEASTLTIPERLSPRIVRRELNWICALITLPAKPSDAIKKFLESATYLEVSSKKAIVQALFPQGLTDQQSGAVRLPASDVVLLSISRKTTETIEDGILVEGKGGSTRFDISETGDTFIRIEGHAPEAYYFVRYSTEPAMLFHITRVRKVCPCTRLLLEVIDATGVTSRVNFFSLRAHKLLGLARAQKFKSAQLLCDGAIEGAIHYRKANKMWRHQEIFHTQDGSELTPLKELDISGFLRLRNLELWIDFRGYGSQYVSSRALRKAASFEPTLISRFQWLTTMLQRTDKETQMALQDLRAGKSDRARLVLTEPRIPPHLRLHARTLLLQLGGA